MVFVFSSGENCDWTIATANAVLMVSTPIYAFILEDYYEFHCYDHIVLKRHRNTATTTTGFDDDPDTANSYLLDANETNVDTTTNNEITLFPCNSTSNTNKSTLATQLGDQFIS